MGRVVAVVVKVVGYVVLVDVVVSSLSHSVMGFLLCFFFRICYPGGSRDVRRSKIE